VSATQFQSVTEASMYYLTTKPRSYIAASDEHSEISMSLTM